MSDVSPEAVAYGVRPGISTISEAQALCPEAALPRAQRADISGLSRLWSTFGELQPGEEVELHHQTVAGDGVFVASFVGDGRVAEQRAGRAVGIGGYEGLGERCRGRAGGQETEKAIEQ